MDQQIVMEIEGNVPDRSMEQEVQPEFYPRQAELLIKLLKKLSENKDSSIFRKPVQEYDYEGELVRVVSELIAGSEFVMDEYKQLVPNPIDMRTMKERLEAHDPVYKCPDDVFADIDALCQNSYAYNEGDKVRAAHRPSLTNHLRLRG